LVYRVTEQFPAAERYGLCSQLRRAATSIAANIAEGFSRNTQKDKRHFYAIALGSLTEALSHSYIASDLGFMKQKDIQFLEEKGSDINKMINGMMKSAQERNT